MKTKEELNALKEEVENLSRKLAELTEEELKQVSGGTGRFDVPEKNNSNPYAPSFYKKTITDDFQPNFDKG